MMPSPLAPPRPTLAHPSHPACVRPRFDVRLGKWVVDDGFTYLDAARGITIDVPPGFVCDLASIPRALWWLIAPMELSQCAPVLHDLLYKQGGRLDGRHAYTRAAADQLFREVMTEEGVPGWRRKAAYRAVRLFGGRAWQQDGGRA